MFGIIKSVVWVVGVLAIAYFVAGKLGYGINADYFSDSKQKCQEKINECSKTVLHQGIDNADKCNFNCVDPQLIMKKN